MKCNICSREDRKAIDRLLLHRRSAGTGVITALAAKLGVCRQSLWRHAKKHLGVDTSRATSSPQANSLEQRAAELGQEADRLQLLAEHGMEAAQFERAMRALGARIKLLEMEGRLAGRLKGGKSSVVNAANIDSVLRDAAAAEANAEADPEEEIRVMKEFAEVCGNES